MEGKPECGFTDYKKLFSKHVHEQFFLKQHMSSIDHEMRQKGKEILEKQLYFTKKYDHVLRPSCSKSKRMSCGDIPTDDVTPEKSISPDMPTRRKSFNCVSQKHRPSVIRMTSFLEPPVDFPYSYNEWHDRVGNGSYDESGNDPKIIRRESLLCSLDNPKKHIESSQNRQKRKENTDKKMSTRINDKTDFKTSNDKYERNKQRFDLLVRQVSEDCANFSPRERLSSIDRHKNPLGIQKRYSKKHITTGQDVSSTIRDDAMQTI